ncbi:hypothetical protein AB5N19_14036 [Seiridium cardinale]
MSMWGEKIIWGNKLVKDEDPVQLGEAELSSHTRPADVVWCYGEWRLGAGYPRLIAETQQPLAKRCVAVKGLRSYYATILRHTHATLWNIAPGIANRTTLPAPKAEPRDGDRKDAVKQAEAHTDA